MSSQLSNHHRKIWCRTTECQICHKLNFKNSRCKTWELEITSMKCIRRNRCAKRPPPFSQPCSSKAALVSHQHGVILSSMWPAIWEHSNQIQILLYNLHLWSIRLRSSALGSRWLCSRNESMKCGPSRCWSWELRFMFWGCTCHPFWTHLRASFSCMPLSAASA